MGALKSKFRRSKSGSRKSENGEKPDASKKKKRNVNLPESQSARKTVDPRLPFTNYRQIFSIRNAWKAISRSLDECAMETMLKFLNAHPEYKEKLPTIKDLADEEQMRNSTAFELKCMDMYGIVDGVIAHLDDQVDKAFMEIQISTLATEFNHKMLQDYEEPFIGIIKQTLGSDRFTETTEDNFKILYQFIREEMGKLIEEDESEEVTDTQVEVNLCTETDET